MTRFGFAMLLAFSSLILGCAMQEEYTFTPEKVAALTMSEPGAPGVVKLKIEQLESENAAYLKTAQETAIENEQLKVKVAQLEEQIGQLREENERIKSRKAGDATPAGFGQVDRRYISATTADSSAFKSAIQVGVGSEAY